ncbi:MAG: autoinducer binding domain-containing protein [Exilibacterium sp.]
MTDSRSGSAQQVSSAQNIRPAEDVVNSTGTSLNTVETIDDDNYTLPDIRIYSELAVVKTVEELKRRLLKVVNQLGFSDFFFTVLNKRKTGILTTFPTEIYRKYLTGDLSKSDLIMQHAGKSDSPVYLSTVAAYVSSSPLQNEVFVQNKKLREGLRSFGFHDTYNIPQNSPLDGKHAIFIVADKGASQERFRHKVERCKSLLYLVSEAISMIGTASFPNFFFGNGTGEKVALNQKPMRLLNTLAKENVTLKQAAVKLCISLDTANKHIAAAKTALGANTQASAIFRAVQEGLIQIDDE